MVLEAVRGYVQLASGLSEVTRERARAAARSLVSQGEAGLGAAVPESVRSQVSALTEELLATSKANRQVVRDLVRAEVDRATSRLGFAAREDLQQAQAEVRRLQGRVRQLERELGTAPSTPRAAKATRSPASDPASPSRRRATGSGSVAAQKAAAVRSSTRKRATP